MADTLPPQAHRAPRWHLLVSLLMAATGLGLTLLVSLHIQHDARMQLEARFRQHALERAALINERLESRRRELNSVRSLFTSSSLVTPDEFQRFTQPLLDQHLAIYYSPLLELDAVQGRQQLQAFSRQASELTGKPFSLLRFDDQGASIPLPPGDRHYPLLMQNSWCTALPLGLDLSLPGPLRSGLDTALDSGRVGVGGLQQMACAQQQTLHGLVLSVGLYRPLGNTAHSPLSGALFSLVNLNELLTSHLPTLDDRSDLSITLLPAGEQALSLHFGASPLEGTHLEVTQALGVGKRSHLLVLHPGHEFTRLNPLPPIWPILLSGSLASLVLAGLLYTLLHQRHHALQLVANRTSELLRSREQLHVVEERWNLALDSAGDGVWDWDLAHDRLYLSPTWKRMLGHREGEIGSSPDEWRNRVHPDDIHQCRLALRNHLRKGKPSYICEHRLRCADGKWKWVLSRGRVVERDDDGTPLRLIGTLSDISRRKALELKLSDTNERLHALLESATQVAIIAVGSHGLIESFNRGAEHLLGYQREELEDTAPAAQLLDSIDEDATLHFDTLLGGHQHCELETRLVNALQQRIPVTLMLSRIQGSGYLLVAIDISERIQARAALEKNSLLLSHIAAQVPGVLFQMRQFRDGHLSMPWVSSGLQGHFGLSPQQVQSDASMLFGRILAEDRVAVLDGIRDSANRLSRWQQDFRARLPGHPARWFHGEAVPETQEDDSVLWHGYLTEINELKRVEDELRTLTITDPLTGIYNRRHFREQLGLELARHSRGHGDLSVIMLDIDHFKRINDRFGHDVGDLVLKEMCLRVGRLLRRIDLFCRLGGEEFAILCPQTDLENARLLAERLRRGLQDENFPSAGRVTASFGIAAAVPGDNGDLLLQRADRALYAAKGSGRNRVCDPSHSLPAGRDQPVD